MLISGVRLPISADGMERHRVMMEAPLLDASTSGFVAKFDVGRGERRRQLGQAASPNRRAMKIASVGMSLAGTYASGKPFNYPHPAAPLVTAVSTSNAGNPRPVDIARCSGGADGHGNQRLDRQ
ncbi:hypothetical protein [Azospirillum argentinense]